MNKHVHPLFAGVLNAAVQSNLRPTPTDDWFTVDEFRAVMRKHLNAALAEIGAQARDLTHIDPDQFMVDLRSEFDPEDANSRIQDCFADAFHAAQAALRDKRGEPLSSKKTLPSGAVVSE